MNAPVASLLLVDDEELNRDMLGRRLELHGYRVTTAENGRLALDLIERQPFDLVLLDVMMPDLNGFQVLRRVRETRSAADLPVIMVTAKSQSSDVVEGFRLGANDYVSKPIDFPVALARISTHVAHRRALRALHESETRLALAVRGTNDGLWDWDLRTGQVYYSPRWKEMLGFASTEIGHGPEEWLGRLHCEDLPTVMQNLENHRSGLTKQFDCEFRILNSQNAYRWMHSRGLAIHDEQGAPVRMAGSQTDITAAKVADPLTGLPNRVLFMDRLSMAYERQMRDPTNLFAVLFLDLDGFKNVNDSLGHRVGDQLLVAVARRLEGSVRSTDTVSYLGREQTVARLGGDEFTILLDGLRSSGDAALAAQRLLSGLAGPFDLCGKEIFVGASIGIAVGSDEYASPEDVLRDADTAMYSAKGNGKARFAVFDETMRARVIARLQLENDLHRALEQQEFRLHYQPILSMESDRIVGFEALLRWEHPERGVIHPDDFIPVAEDTGMITQLGRWALREACRQMSEWHANNPTDPPLRVAVNISSKELLQPDLLAQIEETLVETGLAPAALELEITESSIVDHPGTAAAVLAQMRDLGIQVSIDDFGTGYSSLSYFQQFTVDTVKIDRSFVGRMGTSESQEIVQAIVALAHNLKLAVIAEGVENESQRGWLKALECDFVQGYYYSEPLNSAAAAALVATLARKDDARNPAALHTVSR
jgi:diguanylate cyclase (GGDEF)-like protein/PAS domain S-box-containing protein